MKKTTRHLATIYGNEEDIKQEVEFTFEYYAVRKWFGERSTIFITSIEVLTPLNIESSDLQTDLEVRIAEILGERPEDIRTECLIEFKLQLKATA
jgi:hypothetical protein